MRPPSEKRTSGLPMGSIFQIGACSAPKPRSRRLRNLISSEGASAIAEPAKGHFGRRLTPRLAIRRPPTPALLRYVGLRDAGLGSVRGGHFWTRKGVAIGCDLTDETGGGFMSRL